MRAGSRAPDLAGSTPAGDDVRVRVGEGSWVLVFLTSDCRECDELWRSMSPDSVPDDVVLVTPSPSTESRRSVARLAPEGIRVVMSSEAWFEFGVTKAPSWVKVSAGVVVGGGPLSGGWAEVVRSTE